MEALREAPRVATQGDRIEHRERRSQWKIWTLILEMRY